jgi:hypothetical protein
MLTVSRLLLHIDDVPQTARSALASALQGPAEQRCENLLEAAFILHREVGLDCVDARELVGLDECDCEGVAEPTEL